MACYDENQKEISCALWEEQHQARVAVTGQVGSQYWLNVGYSGPEPTLAEKARVSTAEYARDWIGSYAKSVVGPVSPAVQQIQQTYPEPAAATVALWQQYPVIAPTQAAVVAARATVEPGPGPVHEEQAKTTVNYLGGSGSGGGAGTPAEGGGGLDLTTIALIAIGLFAVISLTGAGRRSYG